MPKMKLCSIGECMIELVNIKNELYFQSFAGDTLNFAAYLNKKIISVDYLSAIG